MITGIAIKYMYSRYKKYQKDYTESDAFYKAVSSMLEELNVHQVVDRQILLSVGEEYFDSLEHQAKTAIAEELNTKPSVISKDQYATMNGIEICTKVLCVKIGETL